MGESSSFLVRSLSQPTSEGKKENTTERALRTSISFGRYMSESLDWGKWSVFTHNIHLEEVERYSRPGAVAEKKAYFEEHFKRRRAEKLLAHENAALREQSDADFISSLDVNMEQGNGDHVNGIENEEEVQHNDFPSVDHGCSNETTNEDCYPMDVENQQLNIRRKAFGDTRCNKDGSTMREPTSSTAKKQEVFARSPFVKHQLQSPGSKRPSSLHMSFNFGSSGGMQKDKSPAIREIENFPRVTRPPVKSCKSSSHSLTSSRVSVNDMFRSQLVTHLPENRALAQHGDLAIRNEDSDSQATPTTTRYSQAANKFGSNAQSPQFSPFTFKTEERAEKRKEFFQKLEEKLQLKEADKQLMHVKSQIPTVRSSSSKAEEVAALKAQDLNSKPPWRLSSKVHVDSKKNHAPALLSQRSLPKRSMNENASPNIYS